MKNKFQTYDLVRVVRLPSQTDRATEDGLRDPRVGDTGAVVMVYEQPSEGYTVEAVATDGSTVWLTDFLPDDLERVSLPNKVAPPEPPLPASRSSTPVRRALDSLPAPGSGGGR